MAIHKLTARKVEAATAGKYEDGGGLRLVVSNTGGKKWVYRFTFHAKRYEMGLGGYPVISLKNARELAAEHREHIAHGLDPRVARNGLEQARPYPPLPNAQRNTSAASAAPGKISSTPGNGFARLKSMHAP